jgi:hypothetical protein
MSEKHNIFNLKTLIPLDIQYFSDGFDITDQQRNDWFTEYENEQAALGDNDETDIEEEVIEQDTDDSETDEQDEQDENPEVQDPETDDHLSEDEQKRNAAFANMRRELESSQQQAAFIKQMADHYGMTPEQLREQWENDRLEKEAEEQNIPVDMLRRQNAQDTEISQLRQQIETQRVSSQMSEVMSKYGANNDDIQDTVQYIQENGLSDMVFSGALPFEQAYKLANMDSMIEKAEKDAVQKNLSDKKKRQLSAQPKPNGGATATVDEDDLDSKAAEAAARIISEGLF